jgi:hypothetical protein
VHDGKRRIERLAKLVTKDSRARVSSREVMELLFGSWGEGMRVSWWKYFADALSGAEDKDKGRK